MTWDKRWMDMAELVASWSKDKSRKTSAVIVDDRNVLVAIGWNGFPRNVIDSVESRNQRPNKYMWMEHAERNAIYNAAANGYKCRGCKMYIPWYPCAGCARAIIQSGVQEVICVEPDWEDVKWGKDFAVVKDMLAEAGVFTRYISWIKAPVSK